MIFHLDRLIKKISFNFLNIFLIIFEPTIEIKSFLLEKLYFSNYCLESRYVIFGFGISTLVTILNTIATHDFKKKKKKGHISSSYALQH